VFRTPLNVTVPLNTPARHMWWAWWRRSQLSQLAVKGHFTVIVPVQIPAFCSLMLLLSLLPAPLLLPSSSSSSKLQLRETAPAPVA